MEQTHFFMEAPASVTRGQAKPAVSRLLLEVCSDGFVTRELGLDSSGKVVHRAPTAATPHCLSGPRPVQFDMVDDPAARQVFDQFWIEESS